MPGPLPHAQTHGFKVLQWERKIARCFSASYRRTREEFRGWPMPGVCPAATGEEAHTIARTECRIRG
jgi:hypothetical protein